MNRCTDLSTRVRVAVTAGPYRGATYEGPIGECPVTVMCPEGISSWRTKEQARIYTQDVLFELQTHRAVQLDGGFDYSIRVELIEAT